MCVLLRVVLALTLVTLCCAAFVLVAMCMNRKAAWLCGAEINGWPRDASNRALPPIVGRAFCAFAVVHRFRLLFFQLLPSQRLPFSGCCGNIGELLRLHASAVSMACRCVAVCEFVCVAVCVCVTDCGADLWWMVQHTAVGASRSLMTGSYPVR